MKTSKYVDERCYAFDAGTLAVGAPENLDDIHLVARYQAFAISCEGGLIIIDRPEEWPNNRFGNWSEIDISSLDAEEMVNILAWVEFLIGFPSASLDAETLKTALHAYVFGMASGISSGMMQRQAAGHLPILGQN